MDDRQVEAGLSFTRRPSCLWCITLEDGHRAENCVCRPLSLLVVYCVASFGKVLVEHHARATHVSHSACEAKRCLINLPGGLNSQPTRLQQTKEREELVCFCVHRRQKHGSSAGRRWANGRVRRGGKEFHPDRTPSPSWPIGTAYYMLSANNQCLRHALGQ